MFGIFADVMKRATYLDTPQSPPQAPEGPYRDLPQRAPFHWSFETRKRLGFDDKG